MWGGRAYAASDLTGTGFAGTAVLGRGIPTAVSYAENSYSVYILSEHGALGGISVLLVYLALLVVVGIWIYRVHETVQDTRAGLAVLAMTVGGVLWLTLPAVYVAASNLALVPLTGQNMPFLGLNSWADVVLVSGLSTGIVFCLAALEEPVTKRGAKDLNGGEAKGGGTRLLPVVGLFLVATALLLLWVGVRTVQASRDSSVRAGLDYETFLEAVDDLLAEAGDSALLRFDEVDEELPRRRKVTFDTIAILADVGAFPSFDRAGFLYDQVQAYNRFQLERLDLGREEPAWWDRLSAFNPSVFRAYQRPDGTRGLTRAPAAWSLRVRSPLEGEWNGEIQARDVVRGLGLLSPRVAIPLRKPVSLARPVGGRNQLCEFVPSFPDVRVYCLSEERIAQATLRLASDRRSQSWAVAGWADLWVDGRRINSGDSVGLPEGSILRLDPLEPVVFGEHWEGVLSSEQWINGRMRRRSDLPPPLDLFSGLGTGPTAVDGRVSSDASVGLVGERRSQHRSHGSPRRVPEVGGGSSARVRNDGGGSDSGRRDRCRSRGGGAEEPGSEFTPGAGSARVCGEADAGRRDSLQTSRVGFIGDSRSLGAGFVGPWHAPGWIPTGLHHGPQLCATPGGEGGSPVLPALLQQRVRSLSPGGRPGRGRCSRIDLEGRFGNPAGR